jgi:hypothetical protein
LTDQNARKQAAQMHVASGTTLRAIDAWLSRARRILDRTGSQADIALRKSYRHSNGFDKICLTPASLHEGITCVHGWWGESEDPLGQTSYGIDEDIHDHPWAFTSTILCGQIRNEQYTLSQNCGSIESFAQHQRTGLYIRDNNLVARALPLRPVHVSLAATRLYTEGEAYTMLPGEFHRAVVEPNPLVATFFQQSPLRKRLTFVLRPPDSTTIVNPRPQRYTTRELREIVARLIAYIKQSL